MRLVKPKKFLGQHFLKDLKVAQDIADTVDACPNLPILEVGPGMGVLTQFLLPKERTIKVVEVDYESVAYLREAYPQLEDNIIEDDFLKMNLHGKLLGAFVEERVFGQRTFFAEYRFYGITQGFPALVECSFYNLFKQLFVTSQLLRVIARHANNSAFYFWGRIEHVFAYGEEVFHPIPSLYQYTQNAVCLAAGTGCDTLGNLFLYHARTARYQFFVIQHLEEYLAGYVIRIIARQYERLSVEQALQVHFQEVVFDDVIFQLRVGFPQIGHRFIIHFTHTRQYQIGSIGNENGVHAIAPFRISPQRFQRLSPAPPAKHMAHYAKKQ